MSKTKDPFAVRMGERVKAAMRSLNLKQAETARALDLDVDTFGTAIRGYNRLQYETLVKLPGVLHRSLYYFLGLRDPSGLAEDEQEVLGLYRSYETPQFKAFLREDARRRLQLEREVVSDSAV